jgi:hypothetical protein
MRSVLLLALGAAGCLKADLVECSDGRLCPGGTVCDVENATCIDPHGISVPEGALDFAAVGCGSMSEITIPLRNFGVSPVDFEARSTISGITPAVTTGTIEPGGTFDLTVRAVPADESIPGVSVEGTLVLSTSTQLLERPMRMTTVGGVAVTSQLVDFGETNVNAPVTRTLDVTNTGNAPFDVTLGVDAATASFSLPATSPSSDVHVNPDETKTFTLAFTPASIQAWAGQVDLTYAGAMCQQPPARVMLSGSGTGSPILVDFTKLDFGSAACGAAPKTMMVTVTNNLSTPQTLTAKVDDTSVFVAPDDTISVPGPGTVKFPVTRAAIMPPGPIGSSKAVLTITADPAGEAKAIELSHTTVAPVLRGNTHAVALVAAPGEVVTKVVGMGNTGTAIATVSITPPSVGSPGGSELSVQPTLFQIGPGQNVPVTFQLIGAEATEELPQTSFQFNAAGQCSVPPTVLVDATVNP